MRVENSTIQDIPAILELYSKALAYQKRKGYNLWPIFEKSFVEKEITEKRSWKITEDNIITCIFSVQYSDPLIWQERNSDPSVYLHRITTNPLFKGRKMIILVRDWAVEHARQTGKAFVRMDTWGNNHTMRDYYISHGFNYLGQSILEKEEQMYCGKEVSLLQIRVK